jgi:hypothetical protein
MSRSIFVIIAVLIALLRCEAMGADKKAMVSQRIATLFEEGFSGMQSSDEAAAIYDSLKVAAKTDPRIDYAYGIVLWRQTKTKEAQNSFIAATKKPGEPYLPAWRAMIAGYFGAKNYRTGFDRLSEFAKLIPPKDGPNNFERCDSIRWMGSVMAAAELAIDNNANRELMLRTEKKILEGLPEDSQDDYNAGKADVVAHHALLENDIQRAREAATKKQNAKLEKDGDKLTKSIDSTKSKSAEIKKSAAELKEEFEEQTKKYEKQMERLERDYGYAERRAMTFMTSIFALERDIELLDQQRRRNANVNQTVADQMSTMLQSQLLMSNTGLQRAAWEGQQLVDSARQLSNDRVQEIAQYEKLTGEIVAEDEKIKKWQERNQKQEETLKKAKAAGKAPPPIAKIKEAKMFRTYIEFDAIAERDRVLKSYGIEAAKDEQK